jgi:hypothetical protein
MSLTTFGSAPSLCRHKNFRAVGGSLPEFHGGQQIFVTSRSATSHEEYSFVTGIKATNSEWTEWEYKAIFRGYEDDIAAVNA